MNLHAIIGSLYRIVVCVCIGFGLLIAVMAQDLFSVVLFFLAGVCLLWGGRL